MPAFTPKPFEEKLPLPEPSIACELKAGEAVFKINMGKSVMKEVFDADPTNAEAYFTVTLYNDARNHTKIKIDIVDKDAEGAIQGRPGVSGGFSMRFAGWTSYRQKVNATKIGIVDHVKGNHVICQLPKWATPDATT